MKQTFSPAFIKHMHKYAISCCQIYRGLVFVLIFLPFVSQMKGFVFFEDKRALGLKLAMTIECLSPPEGGGSKSYLTFP